MRNHTGEDKANVWAFYTFVVSCGFCSVWRGTMKKPSNKLERWGVSINSLRRAARSDVAEHSRLNATQDKSAQVIRGSDTVSLHHNK